MKIQSDFKGKKLIVDINALNYFTDKRIAKIKRACALLETILNTLNFREEFMLLPFVGPDKGYNKPTYDLLMSGASKHGGPDGDIDINLTYYYKGWSKVLGYGYPSSIKTWINGKYLDWMADYSLAGHLCHEYIHKLGFDDTYGTKSVPYQTGYLVEKLGKMVANGAELTSL